MRDPREGRRERKLVIEDERGVRTLFFPVLTRKELEYLQTFDRMEALSQYKNDEFCSLSLNGGLNPLLSIGGENNPDSLQGIMAPASDREENKGEVERRASKNRQIDKLTRIISARRILKGLSQYYERIFKEHVSAREENMSETTRVFFNSNLLYFIAATDSNEDTLGHSQYVASYSLLLAKALGIDDQQFLNDLERGALLHDIGKIGVPESILRKKGPLTSIEREIVKDHPILGHEMIVEFDFLKNAALVVLYHHEHYNGSGYPYGLAGEQIPLGARIFALSDALDAISSDRPYRKGKSFEDAIREIEKCGGAQFDPLIVDAFLSVSPKIWQRVKKTTQNALRLPSIH